MFKGRGGERSREELKSGGEKGKVEISRWTSAFLESPNEFEDDF